MGTVLLARFRAPGTVLLARFCAGVPWGRFWWHVSANSCSAISVSAACLAFAAARCLLRLTRSGRFCLRQMTHWVTASFAPPSTATGRHSRVRSSESTMIQKSKPGTTVKVIPGFDVEHRRFELLTPTLPVLCATNCANAPNRWYIIIEFSLCKALFSRFDNHLKQRFCTRSILHSGVMRIWGLKLFFRLCYNEKGLKRSVKP